MITSVNNHIGPITRNAAVPGKFRRRQGLRTKRASAALAFGCRLVCHEFLKQECGVRRAETVGRGSAICGLGWNENRDAHRCAPGTWAEAPIKFRYSGNRSPNRADVSGRFPIAPLRSGKTNKVAMMSISVRNHH